MPAPRINIEGQKFGRLTALHDVGSRGGKRLWECLCECGKFVTMEVRQLRRGSTKSCGCLQRELAGERAKLPVGEANFTRVIKGYKDGAKKRNLEFILTKEQFKKLTQQNCFYCGAKPHTIRNYKGSNGKFVYNGVDRIDNSKGYTTDNCVTCCFACNRWKRTYTQQEFLMRVKLIHDHMLKG